MLPDPQTGGVWLGFFEGGIAYLQDGEVRASYNHSNGLGNGLVNGLRFGSRGALWVDSEGGLSRIKDGRITTLTTKNGLPCNEVHWSAEDDDHTVWVYMPCGLVRIDAESWMSRSVIRTGSSKPLYLTRLTELAVFGLAIRRL